MEDLARKTLGARGRNSQSAAATLALTDLSVWRWLTSRQLTTAMAADLVAEIVTRWLFKGDGDGDGPQRRIFVKEA